MQTGTGLSVITNNDSQSYNRAVNVVNIHQRDNVTKLESALVVANNRNRELEDAMSKVNNSINNMKKQIFINDALIRNWEAYAPYSYNTELLA